MATKKKTKKKQSPSRKTVAHKTKPATKPKAKPAKESAKKSPSKKAKAVAKKKPAPRTRIKTKAITEKAIATKPFFRKLPKSSRRSQILKDALDNDLNAIDQVVEAPRLRRRSGPGSNTEAGDLQGLSNLERADSESVDELLEEGNAFEAGVVSGVEDADNADGKEVRTREVLEDDVPGEYLDEE